MSLIEIQPTGCTHVRRTDAEHSKMPLSNLPLPSAIHLDDVRHARNQTKTRACS
jgi:hypothetical protein